MENNKLTERKKYWPAEWHTYEIDGYTFNFKCEYYEVNGSSQASLWGHEVEFRLDYDILMTAKISYYNRTWESFKYQSCMLKAVYDYMETVKSKVFNKSRETLNVSRLKSDTKEQALLDDSWYQTIKKLYELIKNGNAGKLNESKELKTEDTESNSDEELNLNDTISLLDIALSEVPATGVEDWGKDNELYFVADTVKLFEALKELEVKIPKSYYENADADDWSNGIDDYLLSLGINPEEGKYDNTYNWSAPLTHDVNMTRYETPDDYYVKLEIHRSGDVRGNYTTSFLMRFDADYDFFETVSDVCSEECFRELKYNDKTYFISPDFWSEYVNISCAETQESWDEVYCTNMEEFKEIIMNKEESKKVEAKEPTNENIAETFKNYKAFKANFGEIIIKKSPYDKNYYIFRPDRPGDNEYIHFTNSRDYVEGWLYGAVQANNKVIAPTSEEKVTEAFAKSSGYSSELCQLFSTLIDVESVFDEIVEYATEDAMYEFMTDKLKESFDNPRDLFTAIIVDGAYTNFPIEEIPNLFDDMRMKLPDADYIELVCEDYGYDFDDMCSRLGI